MMDRREFAASLAATTAGFLLPPAKLGNIGIQLYTVRDLLAKQPEGVLAALGKAGYREVEFAGYGKIKPAAWQAMLGRSGLTAPSAHVTLQEIRGQWPAMLDTAKQLGHTSLVLAYLDRADRYALDSYRRVADVLNTAAAEAKKVGIEVAYHNHDFEFFPLENQTPYDVLLEATDRNLVKLELDLYWITKAARDPLAYFAKWPGRFRLLHIKDMAATATQDMVDIGKGRIDFKKIFARAGAAGVKHYLVEHDQPKDPLAFARNAYDYLRRLEF